MNLLFGLIAQLAAMAVRLWLLAWAMTIGVFIGIAQLLLGISKNEIDRRRRNKGVSPGPPNHRKPYP